MWMTCNEGEDIMEYDHPCKTGRHVVSTYFDLALGVSQPRWDFTSNAWTDTYK